MNKKNFNNICAICNKKFKAQKQKDKTCGKKCCKIYKYNSQQIYRKKFPWHDTYSRILGRCNRPSDPSYKFYGLKGIKCLITIEEVKKLWFRDNAFNMNQPSIDRINPKDNYYYDNCRFIENYENNSRAHKGKTHLVLNFPKMKKMYEEGKLNIKIAP